MKYVRGAFLQVEIAGNCNWHYVIYSMAIQTMDYHIFGLQGGRGNGHFHNVFTVLIMTTVND